jgi:hypothetical protein
LSGAGEEDKWGFGNGDNCLMGKSLFLGIDENVSELDIGSVCTTL